MVNVEEFIKLFTEKLIESGKYPQQNITGDRAIEIIKEVFEELLKESEG